MSKSGRFIVFEGVDHSGKTTQLDLAHKWLLRRGHDVLRLREPGGTKTGERVRAVLLDRDLEIVPRCEMLLFMAARVQVLEEMVLPALKLGKTVLMDRYWYSTAAYQGHAAGLGFELVRAQASLLELQEPDTVIYLDGDPERLAARHHGAFDRIEAKGIEYQRKVRSGFEAIARLFPRMFRTVSAEGTPEGIHGHVTRILEAEGF